MEEDEVGRGVWRRMRLGEGYGGELGWERGVEEDEVGRGGVEEDEVGRGVWRRMRLGEGCGGG